MTEGQKKLAYIGAGALLLWLILKPKKAKADTIDDRAERAFDELEGKQDTKPGLTDEQVNNLIAENLPAEPEPETTSAGSGNAQGRYSVQRGEGWSQIAKKLYGNYRLWPWLWDLNRSPSRYTTLADGLEPGDSIMAPASAPTNAAYLAEIYRRADAYTAWYKNPKTASGRPKPIPRIVSEQTPLPANGGAAV